MQKRNKGLIIGSITLVLLAVLVATVPIVTATPTADNFGVDNANGYQNTNVLVPVNITNTSSGPIAGISFDIFYNNSVISVVGIQAGSLTPGWGFSNAYSNKPRGTTVSIEYGGSGTEIGNGSTGSVAMLNFSVIGNHCETSDMSLDNIQLSDIDGNLGTAPAKNGTFTVAAACSDTWYLHSNTIMYEGNISKPEGTVAVANNSSQNWTANEPATVDEGFSAGIWTGRITLNKTFTKGENFTAEVGSYNSTTSNFTSAGLQNFTSDGSNTTFPLNISANSFTIPKDNYLALQVTNPSAGSDDLMLKTGGSNSYLASPEADPCNPVPELSTFILFSIGLLILAGYIWLRSGIKNYCHVNFQVSNKSEITLFRHR